MKKLFVFALSLILGLPSFLHAQNLPLDSNKKVVYTEVVPMAGMTKEKLYERAIKAINVMYKQADKKIAVKDPVGGLIQMNCSTQVMLHDKKSDLDIQSGYIKYKFNLKFKDGKYRYEFIGFHIDMGGYPKPIEELMPPYKPEPNVRASERTAYLDQDIRKLIKILKENMAKDQVDAKSDW
jgi:hypothetical protein